MPRPGEENGKQSERRVKILLCAHGALRKSSSARPPRVKGAYIGVAR
jgi:hypothetical protein